MRHWRKLKLKLKLKCTCQISYAVVMVAIASVRSGTVELFRMVRGLLELGSREMCQWLASSFADKTGCICADLDNILGYQNLAFQARPSSPVL